MRSQLILLIPLLATVAITSALGGTQTSEEKKGNNPPAEASTERKSKIDPVTLKQKALEKQLSGRSKDESKPTADSTHRQIGVNEPGVNKAAKPIGVNEPGVNKAAKPITITEEGVDPKPEKKDPNDDFGYEVGRASGKAQWIQAISIKSNDKSVRESEMFCSHALAKRTV